MRRASRIRGRSAEDNGLTLLEILMVAALFGIMAGVLLTGFLTGRNSYLSADAYIHVQQQARQAFDIMTKELRNAGNVNVPAAQRLDFQVDQGFETTICGGICWGDGTTVGSWVHYAVDPVNTRLVRFTSANPGDPMPGGCAGCRVLANDVNVAPTATSFSYNVANRTITCLLQILRTSPQLPGGSMGTQPPPSPLRTQVQLRNP